MSKTQFLSVKSAQSAVYKLNSNLRLEFSQQLPAGEETIVIIGIKIAGHEIFTPEMAAQPVVEGILEDELRVLPPVLPGTAAGPLAEYAVPPIERCG